MKKAASSVGAPTHFLARHSKLMHVDPWRRSTCPETCPRLLAKAQYEQLLGAANSASFSYQYLSLVSLSVLYYLVAMKFEVEWKSSHYHSDGRRRSRPKASTFHGWLVKWRATFSGNEQLRREGIREMREAKALQEYKRQQKVAKKAKKGRAKPGLLSSFSFGNAKTRPALRSDTLARGSHSSRQSNNSRQAVLMRAPSSRRPTRQSSRQPSYSSKRDVARIRSSKK